jgi:ABC-type nitrate/sulfonate/bicarbonate transport system ATPase subunit
MDQAPSTVLSCQNLCKRFPDERKRQTLVLADVNLSISRGEFITILGQSGGGKSTLLKLMGGFMPPSSGQVFFHDQLLQRVTPKIGMVFQEHNLYPWMNVEQNIGFGFKVRGDQQRSYRHRVREMIDQVGLTHAHKLYPHQLSGGMKQRVAIARSLVVEPDVLLLDEPFSALDIQLRRRLQEFLLSIWSETSTTMVLVTHNVEEAILLGQRLIVVGDRPGRIIEKVSITASEFRDRYHPKFLDLQRHLESVLDYSLPSTNHFTTEIVERGAGVSSLRGATPPRS